MTISVLAAFLGGALALLSPCSALLLPAFFASSSGVGARLAAHVAVFFAGLLVVLVPLGLGASAIGAFFNSNRAILIWVAGIVIVVFGLMQIFGWGFDLQRFMPKAATTAAVSHIGLARAFLLGISSGVAGFCAGPILGAVLTLAAASGSMLVGGALMVFYAAGMIAPLLVLVMLWHRTGVRKTARGRAFTFAGRTFHTTSLLTGVLLIAVGVTFIVTNGLVGLPEVVSLETQSAWQSGAQAMSTTTQIVAVLASAGVALALWWWWPRNEKAAAEASSVHVSGDDSQ